VPVLVTVAATPVLQIARQAQVRLLRPADEGETKKAAPCSARTSLFAGA